MNTEGGSFRDPRGHVFYRDGRVFRTIGSRALADYDYLRKSGLSGRLIEKKWLIPANEVTGILPDPTQLVVEHERLPFVSYPYEWSFSQLKAAALHQLDVHLEALKHGMTLSDSSAYNVQFVGAKPVFIDLLSFQVYEEGMQWTGHRQFCDQYLHPLIFSSVFPVPFNAWLRSSLEGLSGQDLFSLLPWRSRLSPRTLLHVSLPQWLQKSVSDNSSAIQRAAKRRLPKATLEFMLRSLRDWIRTLSPKVSRTTWGDYYEATQNYTDSEADIKHRIVSEFIGRHRPATVWDLGCNTGEFSQTALAAGATRVIGFDFDTLALEKAYRRAVDKNLDFLPLFQDAANPSPDHGWNGAERKSLYARRNADAVIALAFEHHLAIGRNIPLKQLVAWIVSLAPTGLVEFVPRGDSNLDRLLKHREDVFEDYTEEGFRQAIEEVARVDRVDVVSASGRKLYWYTSNDGSEWIDAVKAE